VTGDEGAAGSAELAWAAARVLPKVLGGSELYGFVDGGRLRFKGRPDLALPGQTYDLSSAGVGARVAVANHAVFQLEGSRELVSRIPGGGDHDWRVVFGYRTNY
jgi:hemolysin activation/secretion protein